MSLVPILLIIHICLAVALFLPSVLLPFALRPAGMRSSTTVDRMPGPITRALVALQGSGTIIIGAGLALTGIGLILALGLRLIEQPWLLVALVIYAVNLAIAFAVQRPNLRRLVRTTAAVDDATWRERARRQRYVSYAMAGLVGAIGWLMSTKPQLW
jgi:predicted integral membrane protein DUF2269